MIRPATPADAPAIAALLLAEADVRRRLDPALWAIPAGAQDRLAPVLATIVEPVTGPLRHHWLLAEAQGAPVGAIHAAEVPAPPIVDLKGRPAGIILDDSALPTDPALAATLLAATEATLREAGAALFVGTAPVADAPRTALFTDAGYRPTTHYFAKSAFAAAAPAAETRAAEHDDIPAIANLGVQARALLKAYDPVFWSIHAEAGARFASWMALSRTLPDRAILVAGAPGAVTGFIIAQPGSPLHVPPPHNEACTGLIDDFHAQNFATPEAAALLAAAETRFHAKGYAAALAICPVKMTEKAALLAAAGWTPTNLWLVKTA